MDRGPPGASPFMPPEATRLFDIALPLLMRSAPDRRNLLLSRHSSGTRAAPPPSWGGAVGPGRYGAQPPVPNATARYSLPYAVLTLWANTDDMYRRPCA